MRLPRISKDAKLQLIIALLVFVVYLLSLAKGFEIFDAPEYAKEMLGFAEDFDFSHFGRTQYLRNPLYIVFTLPLFYLSKSFSIPIEFLLNFFSIIPTVVAVVFIYKTSRLFLDYKKSLMASILFMFIPWVWFNSILADSRSLLLCLNAIWLYYLMRAVKTQGRKLDDRNFFYSTIFLALSILAGIMSAPLIIVHLYFILSHKRNLKWIGKHLAIGVICLPLLLYFTSRVFVQKAEYEISYSIYSFVFTFFLLSWSSVHALSLPLLIVFIVSIFHLWKNKGRSRTLNGLFICSILIIAVHLPFLIMPVYSVIEIIQPVFLVVPLLVMILLSKIRYKNTVFFVLIVSMLVMFLPVAWNLHAYVHPHESYAKFADSVLENGSTVFVGHEVPFYMMYANPSFRLYGEGDIVDVSSLSGHVYVTSQYIENENEVEFKEFMKLPIYSFFSGGYEEYSSIVFGGKELNVTELKEKAVYDGDVRSMEETHEWLYSVYGNIFLKAFVAYDFPRLQYKIYEIEV